MSLKSYISRGLRYIFKGTPVKVVTANISYISNGRRLAGKKIIITGGGKGLGAAMARKFVAEGAEVLIAGRNEKKMEELSKTLRCKYLNLDICDTYSFRPFIEKADELLGGADCLINNAGVSFHEATFFDVKPDSFDTQIATNLKGPYFLTQEFVKMVNSRKGKGNVIFISSETGDTMDFRPYGYSKAAINSMVQGLAYLLAKDQIRVNAIAPGVTVTDMTGVGTDGNLAYEWNLSGRVYLPEEVAETACFLLSDASACISGQVVVCNNANTVNARWK